jgi:pyruvate,water dikinase
VTGLAALERAVLDCWRSYSRARSAGNGGLAVLIQPLLDAECAGVCFTVDPVRLRPEHLLVVSGWGLGAGVVEGSVPTDTVRLRRFDLSAGDVSIADKHTAVRAVETGGVSHVPVPAELRAIPCLPDDWLRRIGEFGLTIEQAFGAPQDIEWAIAGGQVWILQSRPVTALPDEIRRAVRYPLDWENAGEPRHYWWLERARDSAGGPLLPAELDFVLMNLRGGHDAVYFGGFPYTRWRKAVNGRVYMTAAQAPHAGGHARVYGAAIKSMYERLRGQEVTPWEAFGAEVVSVTRQLAAFDARGADGQALADHLEDAIAAATRHWMLHTIGPGRPIRDADLLNAYARLSERQPGEVASEIPFLLSGAETIQTRLVESLYDLACLAQEAPEEAKAVVLDRARESSAWPDRGSFAAALQSLLDQYGDRLCYREVPGFLAELPLPWRESREQVWDKIAAYLPLARRGGPGLREARIRAKKTADERVEELCAAAAGRGVEPEAVNDFLRKLAYARRNASSLDEANHYIDQLSEGQFVQALTYAGRWLAAQGRLPAPLDVFWLHADEVLAGLRGSPDDLAETAAARRAQFTEWQALLPPACLGLPSAELPERPADSLSRTDSGSAAPDLPVNTLRGEPASRGRASGRARLVSGDTLPADIAHGDILVAPYAGPALIPLLPALAAAVLDYGGPGDHFAITAREFGLPAVCATIHATRLIPEGAQVTVDADTGVVTWT